MKGNTFVMLHPGNIVLPGTDTGPGTARKKRAVSSTMKFFLLVICLFPGLFIHAQDSLVIKGTITDNNLPLPAATVSLFKAMDSSLVKHTVSDKEGKFEFIRIKKGSYYIEVSAVGFTAFYYTITDLTKYTGIPVSLVRDPQTLKDITVSSQKPLMEAGLDKLVINPNASPVNAGSTVLEMLEKTPGIGVDKDGNISLKGKQGVLVLIDGKQTYLGGEDLANLLRNMASNQVDQVEIITQPSARFDAAGNAGIINLKTKKEKQKGQNGSISLGYMQGFYPKSSNSFSFNSRNGRLNFFSNGGYTLWKSFNSQLFTRRFRQENNTVIFDQTGKQVNTNHSYNLRLGTDYTIDSQTVIGLQVNGNYSLRKSFNRSHGDFYAESIPGIDSVILADNTSSTDWKNFSANMNYRKILDNKGKELSADLDWILYDTEMDQYSDNRSVFKDRPASQYLLRANLPSKIIIYSAKADYTHPLPKGMRLETGAKLSLVKTDNNAPYEKFDDIQQEWIDDIRKDHFAYTEQVGALYVNFRGNTGKWKLQAGLRGEYTFSSGEQVLIGKKIRRDYFQLFPTLFTGYELNKDNQFRLAYSRRIERPNYQDLNPFQRFLDLYTYNQGNPYLLPQYTHNVELSHVFKNMLVTSLTYSYTNNIINDILRQNEETKVTFQIKENVANRRNIGISTSWNAPLNEWWTLNLYGNIYNNLYRGEVNNVRLKTAITSFQVNLGSQFRITKTWSAEMSGFYQSKELMTSMFIIDPMYVVSFGAAKQIMHNKGSLKLSITDPFKLHKAVVKIAHDKIDMLVKNRWDNQRIGLTFTYRFNKGKNVSPRKKTGGAQDEEKRAGQG